MLLPIHPQPMQKEILSSWMVRLSFANGLPLHTFYAFLLGYKAPIWNLDVDRHPGSDLIGLLSRHTEQSVIALNSLALSSYEGVLFEQLPIVGNSSWILPAGVFHRTRLRAGMQFCPLCLQTDSIPYYRRSWRLALYAICEHHLCVMSEYCPACHTPVAFHRHGIGRGKEIPEFALRFCHRCRLDLSLVKTECLDWPDPHSLSMLLTTLNFFERPGEFPWHHISPFCVSFFQGVRVLIGVVNGRNGYGLRQELSKNLGVIIGTDSPKKHFDFEGLGAEARLKLLLAVTWLIDDWPSRFIELCAEARFTRSRLAEEVRTLPFWLARVADEHLDNRAYIPNLTEIIAAGSYLMSNQQVVTWHSLGDKLGLSRDKAKQACLIFRSSRL